MEQKRVEELLKVLPGQLIEQARPGLAREIKNQIPAQLPIHRMDTINIIVDLRISRLAAAAIILLVILVLGGLCGWRDTLGRDSKLLLKYTLGGNRVCDADVLAGLQKYRNDLAAQGRDVVYYGDRANLDDPYAVLMYWSIPDSNDEYGVILGDMSARTVSAGMLIRLQTSMLREPPK